MDKLKTSEFVSQSYGRRIRTVEVAPQTARRVSSGGKLKGLLAEVLLGIAACSALLYVSLSQSGMLEQSKQQLKDALSYQVSYDDAMGSLQFVKEGAAEVFGISSELGVPVRELNDVKQSDGLVTLYCPKESDVLCAADGEVTRVGKSTVTVDSGEMTTTYGKLSFVCAEVGQTLQRGEVLGRASENGDLTIKAKRGNRTLDAIELMGIRRQ